MSDRLLIQSISASPTDHFKQYMDLQEPIHRAYAARCGADYDCFVGLVDPRANPTWNRIRMMLDAFDRGYRKIMWMDADVLVVRPEHDVFAGTSDTAPLLMTRVVSSHVEMPWKFYPPARARNFCAAVRPGSIDVCGKPPRHIDEHLNDLGPWPQWDVYNDGVLIVNDSDHARAALEFAWENRHAPFEPWHVPGMPELDWLLDYVFAHPESVEQLSDKWNWMGYDGVARDDAAIFAWHGQPLNVRFQMFKAVYDEFYS